MFASAEDRSFEVPTTVTRLKSEVVLKERMLFLQMMIFGCVVDNLF
jgi:hypothetical protein